MFDKKKRTLIFRVDDLHDLYIRTGIESLIFASSTFDKYRSVCEFYRVKSSWNLKYEIFLDSIKKKSFLKSYLNNFDVFVGEVITEELDVDCC